MTAEVLNLIAELKQEGSDSVLVSPHPRLFASPHIPEAKAFLDKIFKY